MSLRILIGLFSCWIVINAATIKYKSPNADDAQYWKSYNEKRLQRLLSKIKSDGSFARNIIIFVGDGMGVQTVTAGRIFKGQRTQNVSGEESELVWDDFPHTGFSKTYNIDRQVPDSAATATALFSGVKAKYRVVGLDSSMSESSNTQGKLHSMIKWAQDAGKRTGFVTTTRVTHATPSALYAHSPSRDYETNSKIPAQYKNSLKDIGRQLVEDEPGNKINVILGGGRNTMGSRVENESSPPYNFGSTIGMQNLPMRSDALNLTDTWLKSKPGAQYVTTATELKSINTANTDYLMGLFANNHMTYEAVRNYTDEPSLAEMAIKAIEVLDRENGTGYVLMVEGGKIDHGHHENFAGMALNEVLSLDSAVEAVLNKVGDDTLIIVTSDHSHPMTFNGYPERGNDILGFGNKEGVEPYETISYANGPGFYAHRAPANYLNPRFDTWRRVEEIPDRTSPIYRHLASTPMIEDTHGGEDVAVYAIGPNANLVQGTMEQSFIAYVMSYSGCIGPAAKYNEACKHLTSASKSVFHNKVFSVFFVLIAFLARFV